MTELTKLNLYRSCRIEQFPNGVMENLTPANGLLDPDFYEKPLDGGGSRAADVDIDVIEGVEWELSGGGTSLFDRAGVFTKPGWLSFEIPDGTPIPESLAIQYWIQQAIQGYPLPDRVKSGKNAQGFDARRIG